MLEGISQTKILFSASLITLFSQGFSISQGNELIFFRKMKISWKNKVAKLAFRCYIIRPDLDQTRKSKLEHL
jgi:hypothetical protein